MDATEEALQSIELEIQQRESQERLDREQEYAD